jgi:anti-sigma B factor antagonist
MAVSPRVEVIDEPRIRVVRFQESRLYDDGVVREVFDQLASALPASAATGFVLDFSGVETISSSMLGKLILLQRRIDGQRGRMRLCNLSNTVRAVFRSTNLDRLFQIDRDLRESREALAEPART